jgi:DNA-binding NtrC family response regulator
VALRNRRRDPGEEPVPPGAPTLPLSILVVHDDPDGCELLVRIVAAADIPVRRSHNVAQMARALDEQAPTAVVLDVSDGGSGANLKALDAIRHHADPAVANTRVVLIAGSGASATFSWQAGIDGFLARPFHADDLVTTVTEVLARPEADRKPHRRRMVEAARVGERV